MKKSGGKKKYIYVLILLIITLLAVDVMAIWITSISSYAVFGITSTQEGGFNVLANFDGGNFVSSNDTIDIWQNFSFNYNSIENKMNLSAMADKIKKTNNSDCVNWQSDCELELVYLNYSSTGPYYPVGVSFNSIYTSLINVTNGKNDIKVHLICKPYSCPQDISVNVSISKIPQ